MCLWTCCIISQPVTLECLIFMVCLDWGGGRGNRVELAQN